MEPDIARVEDDEWILVDPERGTVTTEGVAMDAVSVPIPSMLSVIERDAPEAFNVWVRERAQIFRYTPDDVDDAYDRGRNDGYSDGYADGLER